MFSIKEEIKRGKETFVCNSPYNNPLQQLISSQLCPLKGFAVLTQAIVHMPCNQVAGDGIVSWYGFALVC